jgi:alpha-tubulin suppressor-like RCC1 family protein
MAPAKQEITQLACGKNHTVMLVEKKSSKNKLQITKKLYSFGIEVGVGVEGVEGSTYQPVEVKISKLGPNLEELRFIYAKYNTNVAIDSRGRVFMWGEDTSNLRLRKPKTFYQIPQKGIEIEEISIGKRHGILRTNEMTGSIYGWGDGTYGELGIQENLPIEKPVKIPFFEDKNIVKVTAGARHTLALDYEGNIYAIGDNSED